MYFFFDTETTGLPRDYKAPVSNVDNWPRAVQIAWAVHDKRGKERGRECYIVRPDGYKIPKDAEKIHGISHSHALRNGVHIEDVLGEFRNAAADSRVVVGHNVEYDINVVGAEFYRIGVKRPFPTSDYVCTMKDTTDYCKLPGKYGYKWPKLPELHLKLFGKSVKETHRADHDVTTCVKCFFELKRIRVL
jgi:DNA polymerase III epsilon subunit-like protein